jgi:hypothetical protein
MKLNNGLLSTRVMNQFVKNPFTGEKMLSVNILLNGLDKTKLKTVSASSSRSSAVRRFDSFEMKPESKEDVKKTRLELEEYTENGLRWVRDGNGWRIAGGFDVDSTYRHKLENRTEFNDRINTLLQENGIEISDDEKFRFNVDSHYNIMVAGENNEKAVEIEQILNDAGMGKDLFGHIGRSMVGCPQVLFGKDESKVMHANHLMLRFFGYHIENLVFEGNQAFTPGGKPLHEAVRENNLPSSIICAVNEAHIAGIHKAANISRSIDFTGGKGLLDIYEPYGFGTGQTDWMQPEKFSTNHYTKDEIIEHHMNLLKHAHHDFRFWNPYNHEVWKVSARG